MAKKDIKVILDLVWDGEIIGHVNTNYLTYLRIQLIKHLNNMKKELNLEK